jgi:hypothetical protein
MTEFSKTEVAQLRGIHVPYLCAACHDYRCRADNETWPCTAERRIRDDGWMPITISDYPVATAKPRRRTEPPATGRVPEQPQRR